jgi:two-component system, NarL family, response regulator DevR
VAAYWNFSPNGRPRPPVSRTFESRDGGHDEMGRGASEPLRVYVVDDHEMVRDGIRGMLEGAAGMVVCGEAGDWATARREILALRPDVALVDVRLPDGSGIELIREVRSRDKELRCVVLTSLPDSDAFFHSVVAGAYGYLVKDVSADGLQEAVRRVAAGESLIAAETIEELRQRATQLSSSADDLLRDLTGQEQRILWMITDGLTNREIAVALDLAEKTVRNYVTNILAKVGLRNRTELAVYVAARRRSS